MLGVSQAHNALFPGFEECAVHDSLTLLHASKFVLGTYTHTYIILYYKEEVDYSCELLLTMALHIMQHVVDVETASK